MSGFAKNQLIHGGDYNPEQWLESPDILEQDIALFKKAKINEVSLGIFSWAMLEPEEGKFDFSWMEDIINRLYENGINVIMATPSGARPKWLADKYPEVLRVAPDRRRNLFGGRHNHCYTSPVYREKVGIINRKLAERFGSRPGVLGWHISNELGGDCHCEYCQDAFRGWLRERYGTIEELNRAWATTFWSHRYQSFEQIESPSPIGECDLHGLKLDWRRFVTDRTVDFIRAEVQAIRDGGSALPITTNMMYFYGGLNYHKFAEVIDVASWDNYPLWHKQPEPETAAEVAVYYDIMRGICRKPFLLMESCPSSTNWQSVSKLKKPGMLLAASLQAVAHGSDSVQYFQMRQSRGANEKFHGAVIDHYGGEDTRVFREVTQVGDALESLSELTGSWVKAQAAVIYDWESRWAMEDAQGPRNKGLYYHEAVTKIHKGFRRIGLNVDMPDMEQDLEGYAVVAVPMGYMFRKGFGEKLKKYVEQGGYLILTYWSGIVDDTDLCFLGGTPHELMDVCGVRSAEIDGLYDWESNSGVAVPGNSLGMTGEYSCRNLCDLVQLRGAEEVLRYGSDFYAGQPALTAHTYGKGMAYYVCADFEKDFYNDLCRKVSEAAGVKSLWVNLPEGVELSTRQNEKAEYLFIQNFNPSVVEWDEVPEQWQQIYGEVSEKLPGFGTKVYKRVL